MHKEFIKGEIPSGFWEVKDLSFINTSNTYHKQKRK